MPLNIAGLTKEALDYIQKNSIFIPEATIGCKKSDGIVNTRSSLYKTEVTDENYPIFLFKYLLKEDKECFEEIQTIKNNILFVQLRTIEGDLIKWEETDIENFLN